jgi:hypothetical protein
MSNLRYCKGCGNEIPKRRLEALPGTIFCVGCAESKVSRKVGITQLIGGEEHGYTHFEVVSEDQLEGYAPEQRDILDVEPEQFAKEEGRPIQIKKRNQL